MENIVSFLEMRFLKNSNNFTQRTGRYIDNLKTHLTRMLLFAFLFSAFIGRAIAAAQSGSSLAVCNTSNRLSFS